MGFPTTRAPISGSTGRRTVLAGIAACALGRRAAADPPLRLMVLGDSQAQGLAGGLQKLFRQDRQVRVLDRAKISTGLVSVAQYDWPATVHALAPAEKPDVAVVMFGANDRPPVRIGGAVNPALAAAFDQKYGCRVRDIVATLRQAGATVVWVGHPNVRDARYSEDMATLNHIYEQNTRDAGGDWLPSWDLFAGADGSYAPYGKGPDGATTRLRADDGIHLTSAGYELLAQKVRARLDELRKPQPADAPAVVAAP